MDFIRARPCCVCGSGYWDMEKGSWRNTVSHVKSKGSGGEMYRNVVPMCLVNYCHQQFELRTKDEKGEFKQLAIDLTERFFEL